MAGPGQVEDHRPPPGPQHPGDLAQGGGDRGQVAEDEGREHAVEGLRDEGERLSHRRHPALDRAEAQHLDHRIEADDEAIFQHLQCRPRPTAQVEHRARR